MKDQFVIILLLTLGVLSYSCKETTVEPSSSGNLITNSSFEMNGNPSLAGWSPNDTTSLIQFSSDVPSGGGSWSIAIETVWAPHERIHTTLQPTEGTHRYTLSTWSKKKGVGGSIYLSLNGTPRKSVAIADSTWTLYSIIDTISAVPGDSIVITLAGGFSQLLAGKTYYDLCSFQKLD